MIMDDVKMVQKEGHTNFNVISLTQFIKCLMMAIDKKEFITLLDKYLGRGHFVDVDKDGLLIFGRKKRTPQTVTDEKEDILNLLELKPELHLTSMQIKWLNEWQQPQNTASEPQQGLIGLLPEQLKTDEAVMVFQKAINVQLITYSPDGLRWNDTKQLLAYFATKVSDKFNLTTRLDKDGNKTTDWKTFETLFKERILKVAKQNWMRLNTKFEPTGFEKVDALF